MEFFFCKAFKTAALFTLLKSGNQETDVAPLFSKLMHIKYQIKIFQAIHHINFVCKRASRGNFTVGLPLQSLHSFYASPGRYEAADCKLLFHKSFRLSFHRPNSTSHLFIGLPFLKSCRRLRASFFLQCHLQHSVEELHSILGCILMLVQER